MLFRSEMRCDTDGLDVIIGDVVRLGVGCTMLPGVRIGRVVVVAANSVAHQNPSLITKLGLHASKKIGERS